DQIADVVDIFGFQAVRRAYSQFQIIDGTQQDWIDLRYAANRCLKGVAGAFQGREDGNLVHQDAGGLTHGFFRRDHTIGLDIEDQLVQVGALFHTGAFNRVADAANRAERGIHLDTADRV